MTTLGRLLAMPVETLRLIATHDWASARRVRRYWRERYAADGINPDRLHLPCLWCVHDEDSDNYPIWLWCVRPCRATTDRYGNLNHLGCDWGNQ